MYGSDKASLEVAGAASSMLDSPKTATERAPGVAQELATLERSVNALANTLAELTERVRGVTLDVPPAVSRAGDEARQPERNVCGVAEAIRGTRRNIEALSATVRDLTRRIDL